MTDTDDTQSDGPRLTRRASLLGLRGLVAQSAGASGGGSVADDRTFMRGIQRTDATGLAVFRTIYPGWYRGRTVHIHVKVHVGGTVLHTGQLFFDDSLTDSVFKHPPY